MDCTDLYCDSFLPSLNLSVVVSSDVGGEVRVPTTASLVWPGLVDEKLVTLTPTVVGNTSVSGDCCLVCTNILGPLVFHFHSTN